MTLCLILCSCLVDRSVASTSCSGNRGCAIKLSAFPERIPIKAPYRTLNFCSFHQSVLNIQILKQGHKLSATSDDSFPPNLIGIMSGSTNFTSETLRNVGGNISNSSIKLCATARIPVAPKEVKIAIHVFTLVVALVGNSLLIVAYKRMREPFVLFIANMAASDLLTAIFLIPRLITIAIVDSLAWHVHGLAGTVLCKMCTFLSDISLSVSTQSLVIIAVERFLAVMYPVKTRSITAKTRRLLIASTWILAMAIHTPYLFTMELVNNKGNITICQNTWITDERSTFLRYNIFLLVTVVLIPLIVISILYPITMSYLRRDTLDAERSFRGKKRSRERNIKLLKLAVATVLSFIICWVPYVVIYFVELFAPGTLPACNRIFMVIGYGSRVLASSYCAVNPFICFLFLRNFRGELGNICKRRKPAISTKATAKLVVGKKSRKKVFTLTGLS